MVKRIFRYLRGTTGNRLCYRKNENPEIAGYTNADWGGDVDTRKFTIGSVSPVTRWYHFLKRKVSTDRCVIVVHARVVVTANVIAEYALETVKAALAVTLENQTKVKAEPEEK